MRGESGIHHIYKFMLRPSPARPPRMATGMEMATATGTRKPAFREATLNIAIAPLVSKDQEQIGRLIIFDDITDRAELEQRLVQADKLTSIGLLAAGVAHEVNTPLAVISTYAQMLAKQVADDEQKTVLLEKIAQADIPCERNRQFAAEFLAHVDHGIRRGRPEQGDPGDVSLLEHQLTKAGVQMQDGTRPGARAIHGNPANCSRCFSICS